MSAIWSSLLDELAAEGLRRMLRPIERVEGDRVVVGGRTLRLFCSNNYLGLAGDERIKLAAKQAIDRWGWGAGASRLVSGTTDSHVELEARLARFEGTEAALVFGSGYLANLAAVRAAAGPGDAVFLDKLNHASLIDAARRSGAEVRVYPHSDYRKLGRLLERYAAAGRRVMVTDSVFSMDGDVADLRELAEIKKKYEALLVVDEAHATGVFGQRGRGIAEQQGVEDDVDIRIGTLSKALGGMGGFVAGTKELIEYLVNTARTFMYTTAMPAAACAAAMAALDVVEREPQRRASLVELASYLRQSLREKLCLDIGNSSTQIVPVMIGEPQEASRVSDGLMEAGFLVPAIRPPTVLRGTSRLRVSLTATMSRQDVDEFVEAMRRALAAKIGS